MAAVWGPRAGARFRAANALLGRLEQLRQRASLVARVGELERGGGAGRMNRGRIERRLTRLEQRSASVAAPPHRRWDLACFTDEELELMVPLAEKAEAMGHEVAWTAGELALMTQLEQGYRDRCPSAA